LAGFHFRRSKEKADLFKMERKKHPKLFEKRKKKKL
jgi:hypothetical protein